jgi:alpha-amylase
MLTPGAVQVFYGDESGRPFGATGSDPHQGTRSDMNWTAIENGEVSDILEHWQKLGQFRERHPAIGAGEHRLISQQPYVFSRTNGDDRVVIAFGKK